MSDVKINDVKADNFNESCQSFQDYFNGISEGYRAEVYNTLDFADGNNWDNWTWDNFRDSGA